MEYPQTGSSDSESITHIFAVDPTNFDHPKASFQYSLGNSHGGHSGVFCGLLRHPSGEPVRCNKLRTSCKCLHSFCHPLTWKFAGNGLKVCSEHDAEILNVSHSFVDRISVQTQLALSSSSANNVKKVVFEKTLALFSILSQQKCLFRMSDEATQEDDCQLDEGVALDSDSDSDSGSEIDADIDYISGMDMDDLSMDSTGSHLGPHANFDNISQHFGNVRQHRPSPHTVCSGRMILKQDQFNRYFLQ